MMEMNTTGAIGLIMQSSAENVTGSIVLSLFIVLLFFFAVSIYFQIPFEMFVIIVIPFCLGLGAYHREFMVPVVVIIILISAMIAKNWLIK